VGGDLRHGEIMVDAIDQAVDLQEQIAKGRAVASSVGEVAPYKRHGEQDFDHRSLIRPINTLREKSVQAFKGGQFTMGPTLALAVVDRLLVPGGKSALAPYYFDDTDAACCVSGVLWHAAFGRPGTPVFRHPNFPGTEGLEGHLSSYGLFVDDGRPFPGLALILLAREHAGDVAYGLYPSRPKIPVEGWGADDTQEALHAICMSYNDEGNSKAADLTDARPSAPNEP